MVGTDADEKDEEPGPSSVINRIPTNRNAKLNLQQRSRKHFHHITFLNGGDDILKDVNHQPVDIESRLSERIKPLLGTLTEDLPMAEDSSIDDKPNKGKGAQSSLLEKRRHQFRSIHLV